MIGTRIEKNIPIGQSSETQPEKFEFVPTDALVTFGRGVELVEVKTGEGRKKIWKPTRLVQEIRKNPAGGPPLRTGERMAGEPKEFGPNDEIQEMVAGAKANILATLEWMKLAAEYNALPKEIIYSGGRPGYLEGAEEGITESTVMSAEFKRRLGEEFKGKSVELPPVDLVTESKNTKDDITMSLLMAKEKGCQSVTIVHVSWAMDRTKAFYEFNVLKDHPELADIEVHFVTSDDLLVSRFGSRAEKILERLKATAAHKDTMANEAIGIRKVTEGQYGTGGFGKGKY